MGSTARAAVDDQPAGLVPSAVSLSTVHALYERAHGPLPHGRLYPIVEEWRLVQDGLSGSVRTIRFGHESRTATTLGPFVTENGTHNGMRWEQNRNGITLVLSPALDRDAIAEHLFETTKSESADVRIAGMSPMLDAYVVELNPAGGRHEWYYIDRHSGLLVRTDRIERGRRYEQNYDEFRLFDGEFLPGRIRSVDSLGNERAETLLSRSYDIAIPTHPFDIPADRHTVVEFPGLSGAVRLPARLINGLFVVRVAVAGHDADFLLDSGSGAIAIDPSLAEALSLEQYGPHVNATVGPYAEASAILPQLTIGSLRMAHVACRVIPIPFRADSHTKISGLLGFDFFAGTTLRVDYDHGTVDAYAPGAYRAPDGWTPVPITLDDKIPAVNARIGTTTAHLRIDTGANRTILFSDFADRAGLAAADLASTATFAGVGGIGRARLVQLRSLDFANLALAEPEVEVSPETFALEDADGLLGADLLRNVALWFDYRTNSIHIQSHPHVQPLRTATRN